jgi:hypothetical protein
MLFFMAILLMSVVYSWWIGVTPTHYYKLNEAGASDNAIDEIGLTEDELF